MGSDTSKSADFLQKHKNRQERCRKRLENEPADYLYFALVGTKLEDEMYPIGESAFLRVVRDAPSVFDLAATIEDKSMLSAVDRYAPQVTHELAVKLAGDDVNVTMAVAWAITASLRIRTISDFLVPAAARHSWSTTAGLPADSCSVSLIEDVPRAKRIGPQRPIRADDCEWVAENFRNLVSLHDEHAGFRVAVDSFSTHAQHANLRMSVASLWAGIEGLFVINRKSPVRKRWRPRYSRDRHR